MANILCGDLTGVPGLLCIAELGSVHQAWDDCIWTTETSLAIDQPLSELGKYSWKRLRAFRLLPFIQTLPAPLYMNRHIEMFKVLFGKRAQIIYQILKR